MWDEGLGKELAWDNVNYHGKGLGFIVSHHQSLKTEHKETPAEKFIRNEGPKFFAKVTANFVSEFPIRAHITNDGIATGLESF